MLYENLPGGHYRVGSGYSSRDPLARVSRIGPEESFTCACVESHIGCMLGRSWAYVCVVWGGGITLSDKPFWDCYTYV